jgi:hypothetical protein
MGIMAPIRTLMETRISKEAKTTPDTKVGRILVQMTDQGTEGINPLALSLYGSILKRD